MTVGVYQESEIQWSPQGLFEESATQYHKPGTIRRVADGRKFAYSKAGSALSVGKLTQAPVPIADHINKVPTADVAIGGTSVAFTLGATAAAVNQYKEGFLIVQDGVGEGQMYKIRGHAAVLASGVITVQLYDPIRVAITAAGSEVSLYSQPQYNCIIHNSPPTASLTGVPPINVTSGYWFWNQVKGRCVVLSEGTPAINQGIKPSATVDGAVGVEVETEILQTVGTMAMTGVNGEYGMVDLALPGY